MRRRRLTGGRDVCSAEVGPPPSVHAVSDDDAKADGGPRWERAANRRRASAERMGLPNTSRMPWWALLLGGLPLGALMVSQALDKRASDGRDVYLLLASVFIVCVVWAAWAELRRGAKRRE